MMHKAEGDHERVPSRVMMQTESYPKDAFRNWSRMTDNNYIIGDFVWTGMDYLGEAGIGRWWYDTDPAGEHYERPLYPWHGSYCGDIDLIGDRKPISHYRAILHESGETMYMAVKEPDGYHGSGIATGLWAVWPTWESWNWEGHEGKDIEVVVYSRCKSVRLYLNGRLVGEKPTTRAEEFMATFTVPYEPGELRAVGSDGNAECLLRTAGKPERIRLIAERTEMAADGQDLSYVRVEVTDKDGNICPEAGCKMSASVRGPATVLASGNANQQDSTPYPSGGFSVWKGKGLIVLKGTRGRGGNATLMVSSPGLQSASVRIRVGD